MNRLTALILASAVTLVASRASAFGPSAADRATARQLAQQGQIAMEASDYSVATDRFSRAYELVHAPTLLLGLARAETRAGHLVEANEAYNRIMQEGIGPHASKPYQRAYDDARKEMEAIAPRLCWVIIAVKGPSAPSVTFDDAVVPRASLGVSRAANPGAHEIQALGEGFVPFTQSVRLAEGETLRVTIELEREHVLPPSVAGPDPPAPVGVAPGGLRNTGARNESYLAFGVGGAALVTGVVTGLLAMQEHRHLDELCPNDACSEVQRPAYQRYATLSLISTIGFAVGIAGSGLGVLLYSRRTPGAEPRAAHVEPFVGYPLAGVQGAF